MFLIRWGKNKIILIKLFFFWYKKQMDSYSSGLPSAFRVSTFLYLFASLGMKSHRPQLGLVRSRHALDIVSPFLLSAFQRICIKYLWHTASQNLLRTMDTIWVFHMKILRRNSPTMLQLQPAWWWKIYIILTIICWIGHNDKS